MKLWIINLLLLSLLMACDSENSKPHTEERYINASGGLRMREAPNADAKRILTIPDSEQVQVLERSGEYLTLAGKTGKWTKVNYKGQEGWVFGGFLVTKRPAATAAQDLTLIGKKIKPKSQIGGKIWIKFESKSHFKGYCEGYTESGPLSGTWKSGASENDVILSGKSSNEICADGPALEDESERCHKEGRSFSGHIRIEESGGERYLNGYTDQHGKIKSLPCGGTLSDGNYDYIGFHYQKLIIYSQLSLS